MLFLGEIEKNNDFIKMLIKSSNFWDIFKTWMYIIYDKSGIVRFMYYTISAVLLRRNKTILTLMFLILS